MHPDAPLRRITTWLAVLGYALVASGLPLPCGGVRPRASASAAAKRVAVKERSRPFPCMDKPCGCDTAERCFTSCCCHTPAETLAWARTHGVELDVLAGLERRVAAAPARRPAPDEKESCCGEPSAAACCLEEKTRAAEPVAADVEVPLQIRPVTLRALLACGGVVAEWFAAGGAPPPPKLEVSPCLVCVGRSETADAAVAGIRAVPEPPPPRAA